MTGYAESRALTSTFTRRRVEKLVPWIQRLTDDLLAEADGRGTVDLVSALAYPPIGTKRRDPQDDLLCDLIAARDDGPVQTTLSYRTVEPVEARIAFRTLPDRFPDLRLAVPAESLTRTPSLLMNGLSALPVHLRLPAAA
ncbi:hypothetical protein [Nonomuraea sp. NPDC003201]